MFPPLPDSIIISAEMLRLIEFRGHWRTWPSLTPDRLQGLRRVATSESIGSTAASASQSPVSCRDSTTLKANHGLPRGGSISEALTWRR